MPHKVPPHERRSPPQHGCDAGESALRRQDTQRQRLPRAGGARQDPLPHAWQRREIRRTEGKSKCAEAWAIHAGPDRRTKGDTALLGETRKLLQELG